MRQAHGLERQRLDEGQRSRAIAETKVRTARLRGGVAGLWDRLTGQRSATVKQNEAETFQSFRRDRDQRNEMIAGQMDERRGLQRDIVSVRHRHAATALDLHRDLAKQDAARPQPVRDRGDLGDTFANAAWPKDADRRTERLIVRGRTRVAERDGPGLG